MLKKLLLLMALLGMPIASAQAADTASDPSLSVTSVAYNAASRELGITASISAASQAIAGDTLKISLQHAVTFPVIAGSWSKADGPVQTSQVAEATSLTYSYPGALSIAASSKKTLSIGFSVPDSIAAGGYRIYTELDDSSGSVVASAVNAVPGQLSGAGTLELFAQAVTGSYESQTKTALPSKMADFTVLTGSTLYYYVTNSSDSQISYVPMLSADNLSGGKAPGKVELPTVSVAANSGVSEQARIPSSFMLGGGTYAVTLTAQAVNQTVAYPVTASYSVIVDPVSVAPAAASGSLDWRAGIVVAIALFLFTALSIALRTRGIRLHVPASPDSKVLVVALMAIGLGWGAFQPGTIHAASPSEPLDVTLQMQYLPYSGWQNGGVAAGTSGVAIITAKGQRGSACPTGFTPKAPTTSGGSITCSNYPYLTVSENNPKVDQACNANQYFTSNNIAQSYPNYDSTNLNKAHSYNSFSGGPTYVVCLNNATSSAIPFNASISWGRIYEVDEGRSCVKAGANWTCTDDNDFEFQVAGPTTAFSPSNPPPSSDPSVALIPTTSVFENDTINLSWSGFSNTDASSTFTITPPSSGYADSSDVKHPSVAAGAGSVSYPAGSGYSDNPHELDFTATVCNGTDCPSVAVPVLVYKTPTLSGVTTLVGPDNGSLQPGSSVWAGDQYGLGFSAPYAGNDPATGTRLTPQIQYNLVTTSVSGSPCYSPASAPASYGISYDPTQASSESPAYGTCAVASGSSTDTYAISNVQACLKISGVTSSHDCSPTVNPIPLTVYAPPVLNAFGLFDDKTSQASTAANPASFGSSDPYYLTFTTSDANEVEATQTMPSSPSAKLFPLTGSPISRPNVDITPISTGANVSTADTYSYTAPSDGSQITWYGTACNTVSGIVYQQQKCQPNDDSVAATANDSASPGPGSTVPNPVEATDPRFCDGD